MPELISESVAIRAPSDAKRFRARIIEGDIWGASGFYSKEVLQEAAQDRIFEAGKPVFFDHPGLAEQDDRPGRSVRDLAGKLTTDAVFEGDGLYADVEFYPHVGPIVAAMAEDIGLSIRAMAEVSQGEAAGRRGTVVSRLTEAVSVDLVTRAGAGGKLVTLLESAAHGATEAIEQALSEEPSVPPAPEQPAPTESPIADDPQSSTVTETDGTDAASVTQDPAVVADPAAGTAETHLSQEEHMPEEVSGTGGAAPPVTSRSHLEEQIAKERVINQRLMARDKARPVIAEDLALGVLTPLIVQRLTEELTEDLPMVNGELDVVTLRDRIKAKRDRAELELGEAYSLNGFAGTPRGLGGSGMTVSEGGRAAEFDTVTEDALARTFGLSAKAAKAAVEGR